MALEMPHCPLAQGHHTSNKLSLNIHNVALLQTLALHYVDRCEFNPVRMQSP